MGIMTIENDGFAFGDIPIKRGEAICPMPSKTKIFIDGREGTTGLCIDSRLEGRVDLELLHIDDALRKDPTERKRLINEADVVFLCLPDDAARESVSFCENDRTVIIDASTAHRTNDAWAYGLPELGEEYKAKIIGSKRIAVPGCYATGFLLLMQPLVKAGLLPADYPVTCAAASGYSGGGKKLIAVYDEHGTEEKMNAPRFYATGLNHKHLPEMQKISGLQYPPVFLPMVGNYYNGMTVVCPILPRLLPKKVTKDGLRKFYGEVYAGEANIQLMPADESVSLDNGFLGATECNGTNNVQLFILGNDEQIMLASRLDNLGKGASLAAVQLMEMALGGK